MDCFELGQVIMNRRKEIGITQELLSEYSGLSKNTIYKIERGQANPSVKVLNKILEVLGLQLNIEVKSLQQ